MNTLYVIGRTRITYDPPRKLRRHPAGRARRLVRVTLLAAAVYPTIKVVPYLALAVGPYRLEAAWNAVSGVTVGLPDGWLQAVGFGALGLLLLFSPFLAAILADLTILLVEHLRIPMMRKYGEIALHTGKFTRRLALVRQALL